MLPRTPIKQSVLESRLKEAIEAARAQNGIARIAVEVMRRFDGKTTNARIATALKEALPVWTVFYEARTVQIWGNGLSYDNRLSFNLIVRQSYGSPFDYNGTEIELRHYLRGDEHADKLQAILNAAPGLVNRYNAVLTELGNARDAFGEARYLVQG
jgi:hypothetical protein